MNTSGKQNVAQAGIAQANKAAALKIKVADIEVGSIELAQTVAVIADEGQIPSEAIMLSKKLQNIVAI
ncbi:MAG: hypothetical protein LBV04_05955 [Deferribacteraceae bacterium]|jgi:hypothetical protein|nr:hypothetical protein [Deferribacteraceae bacterium]